MKLIEDIQVSVEVHYEEVDKNGVFHVEDSFHRAIDDNGDNNSVDV